VQNRGDLELGKVQVITQHHCYSLALGKSVEHVPQLARVIDVRMWESGSVATLDQTSPMVGTTSVYD
jgi:hypothetical protein